MSPSQNQDEFDSFSKNLEITLDKLAFNNPFMLIVIGDLNAKSKNWYPLDRTTYDSNIIETITSHFGLHQLIHDPTHILEKSSSCIDLIFTSQPNMVIIFLFIIKYDYTSKQAGVCEQEMMHMFTSKQGGVCEQEMMHMFTSKQAGVCEQEKMHMFTSKQAGVCEQEMMHMFKAKKWETQVYGSYLSHIFEKPRILIEKPSNSIEKVSILI